MNYKYAYKAELIASKIKKITNSTLPAMMFHSDAYNVLMKGNENHYLSEQEIKECEEITEDQAEKIINNLP